MYQAAGPVSEAYEEIAAIIVRDTAYPAASDAKVGCARGPGSATATGWQRCSDISDSKITSRGNLDADHAQAFVAVAPEPGG